MSSDWKSITCEDFNKLIDFMSVLLKGKAF